MSAGRGEKELASRLLAWWRKSKRSYPWRKEKDPYKVLIAELMLQRTKADQVMAVYTPFLEKFPTPRALAAAQLKEVEDFFRRLGLVWRARKAKELADELVANFGGRVPDTSDELLSLPGVGEYAANAVLASVYGKNVAAVDSNVCRVLGRLFGTKARGEARRDPKFRGIAQRMVPKGRARYFNWAMIDFAAMICVPKKPKCGICQLKGFCKHIGDR